MIDRIVDAAQPVEEPQEVELEVTLRPRDFTNYIGQERLKQNIQLAIAAAKKRGEKSMALRLANELIEATEGRGGAMKKRDEVHRMAEANKAFSHFRF